jgi:hypothetical protein
VVERVKAILLERRSLERKDPTRLVIDESWKT